MRLSIVAAIARNGTIGRDGGIPWRVPEDVARFKELTSGHAVVMGRRTWESLPERFRPLPDRRNVVVTRQSGWAAEGAERAASLEGALELLDGTPQVFVIGGAELYAAALPLADELLLTEIDAEVEGDAFFPDFDRDDFVEVAREQHVTNEGMGFAFVTLRPRRAATSSQLAALASVDALLSRAAIPYWLFGGWAVDFYAGVVTRVHDDVDIAVWHEDLPRLAALLEEDGWTHAPEPDEDGGTGYERAGVRLELTFLAPRDDGRVVTRLRHAEAAWPEGAFGDDTRELDGVTAHVIGLSALAEGKASPRDDPADAAKDRADSETLSKL